MNWRGFLAAVWAGAAMLLAGVSWGHGPGSEWIMQGDYRDNWGVHCCTPGRDCMRAEPGEVVRILARDGRLGWRHVPSDTVLWDGAPGIHRSETTEMWRCVRGGEMRCLFIAGGM